MQASDVLVLLRVTLTTTCDTKARLFLSVNKANHVLWITASPEIDVPCEFVVVRVQIDTVDQSSTLDVVTVYRELPFVAVFKGPRVTFP